MVGDVVPGPPFLARIIIIEASRAFLARENPDIGVFPVVENTKSCPRCRGSRPRMLRAGGDKWTSCGLPFFIRAPGISQVAPSGESSDQRIPATSSRRCKVNMAIW
jgi:hypothetical protein